MGVDKEREGGKRITIGERERRGAGNRWNGIPWLPRCLGHEKRRMRRRCELRVVDGSG